MGGQDNLYASTGNATLDEVAAYSGGATTIEVIEWAVLLGIVLIFTILRTYARAAVSGIKGLSWDDALVWLAALAYIALSINVFVLGVVAGGMANDGVTPERAIALAEGANGDSSQEFYLRTLGSQQQVVKWGLYSFILWSLKGSALHFFSRRIAGEIPGSKERTWISAAILLVTWAGTMAALFSSCRPFNHYWQVTPDPGMLCTAAISPVLIYVFLGCNIFTDLYLVSLPVPVLIRAPLKKTQKLSLICLFGCNILISGMTIVRAYFIMKDPWTNGDGKWDLRECYMASLLTSLPAAAPLLRKWFSPCFGRLVSQDATELTRSASTASRITTKSVAMSDTTRSSTPADSLYDEKDRKSQYLSDLRSDRVPSGQSQIGVALTYGANSRGNSIATFNEMARPVTPAFSLPIQRHAESGDLGRQGAGGGGVVVGAKEPKEFV